MISNFAQRTAAVLLVCMAFGAQAAEAENLQGAKTVLQQAKPADSSGPIAIKAPVSRWPGLRSEIQDFQSRAAGLTPEAAARGWLTLAVHYSRTKANPGDSVPNVREVTFQDLLGALPPPAAWPLMETMVKARPAGDRRNRALRLLFDTLNNHEAAQMTDAGALLVPVHGSAVGANEDVTQVADALIATATSPKRLEDALNLRLMLIPGAQSSGTVSLPDLVSLLGREKAARYLERALMLPRTTVSIDAGDETKRLARQIALANIARLPSPQWSLPTTVDSVPLYAALAKRFPDKKAPSNGYDPTAYARRGALPYYFLGLIVEGRAAQAAKIADSTGGLDGYYAFEDAIVQLRQLDRLEPFYAFLQSYLPSRPGSPLWSKYLQIAAELKKSGDAPALARRAASAAHGSAKTIAIARRNLANALLAADQVDAGAAALRLAIAADDPAAAVGDAASLARLGQAAAHPAWIDEGLRDEQTAYQASSEATWSEYGALLVESKRYAEAEIVYAHALSSATHASNSFMYGSYSESDPGSSMLSALVSLYQKAERPQDVVDLLDAGAYWGMDDLAKMPQSMDRVHILYAAASSLAAVGRTPEAIAVVKANLQWWGGGYDPNYALLTRLEGEKAIPFLDDLFAHDRFEERPLIWKADLLRRAGRLEEAENAVRAAIAIDPSDGDEPHGDRMRAYSVLADIREARGAAGQARGLRAAVSAIRLAERGDDQLEAGLLGRATATYEEASRQFADAYCIQSRLAVRLSAVGRTAAAEDHYRRAFELMPTSFGRMESHCFGCEGAFQGKQAQSIAERVFTRLLAKSPNKPQLHYLLGYLREEQGNPAAAMPEFVAAATLDPDYLNAWLHILSVGSANGLPASPLRDKAVFNLLRLDPQGRHLYWRNGGEPTAIRDLAGYWKAVAAVQPLQPAPVSTLYPLPSSAALMEQRRAAQEAYYKQLNQQRLDYGNNAGEDSPPSMDTPQAALAAHQTLRAVGQLLDGIPMSGGAARDSDMGQADKTHRSSTLFARRN